MHSDLLSENDLTVMCGELEGYKGKYYLQNYRDNSTTIGEMKNQKYWVDTQKISGGLEIVERDF